MNTYFKLTLIMLALALVSANASNFIYITYQCSGESNLTAIKLAYTETHADGSKSYHPEERVILGLQPTSATGTSPDDATARTNAYNNLKTNGGNSYSNPAYPSPPWTFSTFGDPINVQYTQL